jgi:hypothetical protein
VDGGSDVVIACGWNGSDGNQSSIAQWWGKNGALQSNVPDDQDLAIIRARGRTQPPALRRPH